MSTDNDSIELKTTISLAEATELLHGRGGRPPAMDTVRRWCLRGAIAGSQVVRLWSVRVGGDRRTSAEACREFEAARVRLGELVAIVPEDLPRQPKARMRAHERAEEFLRKEWGMS